MLRHGQAEWIRNDHAVENPPLTPLGRRQIEAAAEALRHEPFDQFLASPVARAWESAQIVGAARQAEPQRQDWLAEIRVPTLGRNREEFFSYFARARQRPPAAWWDGFEFSESFREFHQRIAAGLYEWLARDHGLEPYEHDGFTMWRMPEATRKRRVLLVAHGGTISVITGILLGVEPTPWEWERFDLNLAGIYRLGTVELAGSCTWSLRKANDTTHLQGIDDDVQSPLE